MSYTDDFFNKIKDGAIRSWENHKILPSLVASQGALESGWGRSGLAVEANNLFGIKASADWTGDKGWYDTREQAKDGSWITIKAEFRKYDSWADSIEDHGSFFTSTEWRKENYKHVVGEENYIKAVEAILEPVAEKSYATDLEYREKIISVIEKYKLYEWDNEVLSKVVETPIEKTIEEVIPESMPEPVVPKPIKLPVVELRYNEYRVVSGDTLYSIAKAQGVTIDTLVSWNNLQDKNYIKIGDILVVKNGVISYNVVSGDTLWKISRKFQTTVESIKSLNNLTSNTIYVGQVLKINGFETVTAPQPEVLKQKQITYTVKAGDRLLKIAKKYDVTVEEIARANGLSNPDFIRVGQKLVINARKNY